MHSSKTVVLGEASESDSEEISLRDENQLPSKENQSTQHFGNETARASSGDLYSLPDETEVKYKNIKSTFGSSLLASLAPTSTLAKLVNYSSSYNLLSAGGTQSNALKTKPSSMTSSTESLNSKNLPSLLHKTLYLKNQQLHACLTHLHRHPYEKACKDFYNISQRLVNVQKAIQELDSAVIKIKREQKNLPSVLKLRN